VLRFSEGTEGQAYWYHLDGRGSVAGLTKHQGQSTHNYRYDAYGQVLPAQGNWTDPHNHYTFLGKEWDEHLGLYEFGFRLYDPWAGVWLTREPLPGRAWEPRTWHRYVYAYANPISYYDSYGLQGQSQCETNLLELINRLRRSITGPYFGARNVLFSLPTIYHFARQYEVDPALIAAIVYYESDAIERLFTNLSLSPAFDLDLWKFMLTGEASIGMGQVRVKTAIELERNELIQPITPDWPLIGRRGLVALRLAIPSENIGYVAANLAYIREGIQQNIGDLELSEEEQIVLTMVGYNIGREAIIQALQEAQRGQPQALKDYLSWPYAQCNILPFYNLFRRVLP